MREHPIEVGRIVRSRSGRDAGSYLMVLSVVDDDFALVADGRLRPLERPKKKNRKHLFATPACNAQLLERMNAGLPLQNADIRKALEEAGYGQVETPRKEG